MNRVNKTAGSPRWAGVEADVYEIALDLRPILTQKVFSGTTGVVRFMLDDETTGSGRLRIDLDYGPSDVNTWVQLVCDFSEGVGEVYDQLRLNYNNQNTTTEPWYFDDVMAWPDTHTPTSVEEAPIELISVYPNPSSGMFQVDTQTAFPLGSAYELEVLDVQGRSVLRQQVLAQGQPVAVDLHAQPTVCTSCACGELRSTTSRRFRNRNRQAVSPWVRC
ncbi:MAG: hypothetical protein D6722_18190 [Bacteroidetes bacterium]|nr:MAG: hypothetical protein D6722_18190 [Bacteroidota bacterium]